MQKLCSVIFKTCVCGVKLSLVTTLVELNPRKTAGLTRKVNLCLGLLILTQIYLKKDILFQQVECKFQILSTG